MSAQIVLFLHGATTLACVLIAVKFFKFWRTTKDRFFLWFAAAFGVFAVGWMIRAFATSLDHVQYVYIPRLLAFTLIIAAILDKNRKRPPE
jgi:hypothetical protein